MANLKITKQCQCYQYNNDTHPFLLLKQTTGNTQTNKKRCIDSQYSSTSKPPVRVMHKFPRRAPRPPPLSALRLPRDHIHPHATAEHKIMASPVRVRFLRVAALHPAPDKQVVLIKDAIHRHHVLALPEHHSNLQKIVRTTHVVSHKSTHTPLRWNTVQTRYRLMSSSGQSQVWKPQFSGLQNNLPFRYQLCGPGCCYGLFIIKTLECAKQRYGATTFRRLQCIVPYKNYSFIKQNAFCNRCFATIMLPSKAKSSHRAKPHAPSIPGHAKPNQMAQQNTTPYNKPMLQALHTNEMSPVVQTHTHEHPGVHTDYPCILQYTVSYEQ